jgi:hypothetical protein
MSQATVMVDRQPLSVSTGPLAQATASTPSESEARVKEIEMSDLILDRLTALICEEFGYRGTIPHLHRVTGVSKSTLARYQSPRRPGESRDITLTFRIIELLGYRLSSAICAAEQTGDLDELKLLANRDWILESGPLNEIDRSRRGGQRRDAVAMHRDLALGGRRSNVAAAG